MAGRDDDHFRPKVGPPKARGRGSPTTFISRVLKQTSRAGRTIGNSLASRRSLEQSHRGKRKQFGRGQVAARVAGRYLDARARRVTIKTRLVNLKKASPRSTEQHLRYIERDGVTREGGRGQLFDARNDFASAREFEERGRDDRHQFRIIVAPEDGEELGDLRSFARDFMAQTERDLGTRLEWVGVDHWDTDQPHIHLVVRGKDELGADLIIAPEYISHGMRARASELATAWLGRRSELEIRESLTQEIAQEKWTSLDRTIQSQARDDEIIVLNESGTAEGRFRTGLLIARLDRLAQMDLAKKVTPLRYQLAPDMESTLRAMGERGDIIRTMQRAMGPECRECATFDHADAQGRIIGRVVERGLSDELTDRGYLIIDALDGRAHYVRLQTNVDLTTFATGSIVEVRAGNEPRRVDRNIQAMSEGGIYRAEQHLASARTRAREGLDPEAYVQSHVRRLEALRRVGIVERVEPGVWRVPRDLIGRAAAFDTQRVDGSRVDVRSALSIEQQVRVIGSTWLDEQLVGRSETLAVHGFGADVRAALDQRTQFLIENRLAERRGQRVIFARDLLATLRKREVDELARRLEIETGRTYRPIRDGQSVAGIYSRSFTLASGRFAMLDDATGFALVPWRPVIDKRIGQSLSAIVRGEFVSWELSKNRGLSR